MKKIPLLFLSALTSVSLFTGVSPVQATIEKNGTTWWTVEELLEFYQETEVEKEAECGDNLDCRINYNFSLIERGPKYSALNNLIDTQVWVTSVNPAAETIKVLVYDKDMMQRPMEEYIQDIILTHLYFGWFDDWNGQIYNYNEERFTNGSMSGLHTLYVGSDDELSWITPWEEVELSVAGGELFNNTSGKLDYAAFADNYNAQGYFDFSSCLSDENYELGKECKMYISGDQWISYFPAIEAYPEENQEGSELDTSDNQENEEPQEADIIEEETEQSQEKNATEEDTEQPEVKEKPQDETNLEQPEVVEETSQTTPDKSDSEEIEEASLSQSELTTTSKSETLLEPIEQKSVIKDQDEFETENVGYGASTLIKEASPFLITPDTGRPTSEKKGSTEDAGILVFIITTTLILAIWWFIPTHASRERKKYKKSIDKNFKLR